MTAITQELRSVVELLRRAAVPEFWIAGGCAIDLYLQRSTREHHDMDIALTQSLTAAQEYTIGEVYQLEERFVKNEEAADGWTERYLTGIPRSRHLFPRLDLFIICVTEGVWNFRNNSAIRRPIELIGQNLDGVPFIAPEVVLLYKATRRNSADDADFVTACSRLNSEPRRWLAQNLQNLDSAHPWLALLSKKEENAE